MADVQIGPSIRAQLGKASPVIGRFEAMILLGFVIGKPREYLIAHDEAELTEDQILQFDMLVDMRAAGTPVPYLTGSQEFFGRHFHTAPGHGGSRRTGASCCGRKSKSA